MPSTLTDAEVEQLMDDAVAASKEQLQQIKAANQTIQTLTAERDALQVKAAALSTENETLKANTKVASAGSLPVAVCEEIADSLVSRGILSSTKKASFAANLSRDPALVKFAFEKLAERIPLTAFSQGSAFVDANAQFQGAISGGDSGVPWM